MLQLPYSWKISSATLLLGGIEWTGHSFFLSWLLQKDLLVTEGFWLD